MGKDARRPEARLSRPSVRAFRIPTDASEADGTLEWEATTLVLVEIAAAGKTGLGYSYASAGACAVIDGVLAEVVEDGDAFDIPGLWKEMVGAVRNLGWRGICASAISAVDVALWEGSGRQTLHVAELLARSLRHQSTGVAR